MHNECVPKINTSGRAGYFFSDKSSHPSNSSSSFVSLPGCCHPLPFFLQWLCVLLLPFTLQVCFSACCCFVFLRLHPHSVSHLLLHPIFVEVGPVRRGDAGGAASRASTTMAGSATAAAGVRKVLIGIAQRRL